MSLPNNSMPPVQAGKSAVKPNKPTWEDLAGIGILILMFLLPVSIYVVHGWYPAYRDKQVLEHGIPAIAEILSIKETGEDYRSPKPKVKMHLRVHPPDAPVLELSLTTGLTVTELIRYSPGSLVEIRYDPEKPNTAVLIGLAPPTHAESAE